MDLQPMITLDIMLTMLTVVLEVLFRRQPLFCPRDVFLLGMRWIGTVKSRDLGIWKDEQIPDLKRIVDVVHLHDAKMGIQLAHAGRKASTYAPSTSKGHDTIPKEEGGWQTVAPSAIAFGPKMDTPKALSIDEIHGVVDAFAAAAKRAVVAGYDFIQIHAAHGFLLHEFLSPLSNHRTDEYGGSFENRTRIVHEVVRAIRPVIPDGMPLFIRISMSDFIEGGWDLDQSCQLILDLKNDGIDGVDCSSGSLSPAQQIPKEWDFQLKMGAELKKRTGALVILVGGIGDTKSATYAADELGADAIDIGKAALRYAFNPHCVALDLGQPVPPFPLHLRWAYRVPSHLSYSSVCYKQVNSS